MTPEQIRNQCEDDADHTPSDLTVWRDRGLIIAAQQTRIAQLEREVGRLLDRVAYLTPFGSDFECCASGSCEVCRR